MFEIVFAATLIAATIGFFYVAFQMRETHSFISVMFFELGIMFVWVGLSASYVMATCEETCSETIELLNQVSGTFVWIVAFTLFYFMIVYVKDLLGSIGKGGN